MIIDTEILKNKIDALYLSEMEKLRIKYIELPESTTNDNFFNNERRRQENRMIQDREIIFRIVEITKFYEAV